MFKNVLTNVKLKQTYLIPVLIIFGGLGAALLIRSFAATGDVVAFEGENGVNTGSIAVINDANASGGKYLVFRPSGSTSPSPSPSSYPILPARPKIMPLGDSITEGESGQVDATYRYPVQDSLRASQCQYDMVGSASGMPFKASPPGYDDDHEGHGGLSADGILHNRLAGTQTDLGIPDKLLQFRPDIVLVHLGTNDSADNQPIAQTTGYMSTMIDNIRAANPKTIILLAKLIPNAPTHDNGGYAPLPLDYNTRVDQLNTSYAQLASQKTSATSPIIMVDMFSNYNADQNNFDQLHPNETGAKIMSDRWWAALKPALDASKICGVSSTPPAPQPAPQPAPAPSPTPSAALPVGRPGNFTMAWNDEFNASTLNMGSWTFDAPWGGTDFGGQGHEHFTHNSYSLSGGLMKIFLDKIGAGPDINTIMIHTKNKVTVHSGQYIEFKVKGVRGNGLWDIAWIMPNSWPDDGCVQQYEMDVYEHLGRAPNDLNHSVHVRGACPFSVSNIIKDDGLTPQKDYADNFHVIGEDWYTDHVQYYVDGQPTFRSSYFQGHDEPGFILLNGFTGNAGDGWADQPDGSTPSHTEFQIDYVRVWNRN